MSVMPEMYVKWIAACGRGLGVISTTVAPTEVKYLSEFFGLPGRRLGPKLAISKPWSRQKCDTRYDYGSYGSGN